MGAEPPEEKYIFTPFLMAWAGYDACTASDAEAGVYWVALVAGSLAAGGWVWVPVGGGCESASDQGAGAKRRLAGEAVWRDGVDGLWRRKVWETSGSQTPTKIGIVRLADGLSGLGRNGPLARTKEDRSRQRMLPCTDPPALGVAGSDGHTQRQQPERLPPGRPEHFWRGLPRQRCEGIAAGYDQAEGLPRSGSGGSELARVRDS